MSAAGARHSIDLEVEPVAMATDKAVSIGVIVTELVTNAYKYAYPAGGAGAIRVRLKRIAEDRVALTVEDDGVGWRGEGGAQGSGLGERIVHALAKGLRSLVEFDPAHSGTRITLAFAP